MSTLLVIVACIALNAALAALEIAFVSASKADIRTRATAGDVRVWHFLRMRETPERTLSAIQVGITLVSLLSGAVGGAGAQEFVSPFLQQRLFRRNGEVVGVLHTKELLTFLAAGERDWRTLVRPAVTVGPDDPLLSVLRLLQARRSHMGIVLARDGTPVGIVTLEDILEEVLGDLCDEDDDRAVERLLAARGKLTEILTRRPLQSEATTERSAAQGGRGPHGSNQQPETAPRPPRSGLHQR